MKDQTLSIQKFAVSENLDARFKAPMRKRKIFSDLETFDMPHKKTPKKNTLIEEDWGKVEQQPLNVKAKAGNYQQAPKHKFDTFETSTFVEDDIGHDPSNEAGTEKQTASND